MSITVHTSTRHLLLGPPWSISFQFDCAFILKSCYLHIYVHGLLLSLHKINILP